MTKKVSVKYGKLPVKKAEVTPWYTLCVDLIGPYSIKHKGKTTLTLWCVTMIDPTTGWFEISELPGTKQADEVTILVEQTWLNRYPWPQEVITDGDKEFMAEFTKLVKEEYGAIKKVITKRNPQANAIIERVHQTIGNLVRSFEVHHMEDIDEKDPWSGILTAVAFAVRSTIHTTLQATPAQLVFGRDSMLNIPFTADWKMIQMRKQKLIEQNAAKENAKRLPYKYQVGDQVKILQEQKTKYGQNFYKGPYQVVRVGRATVTVDEGKITDVYNIRQVKPYYL